MNILAVLLLSSFLVHSSGHQIRVINNCPQDIWVGTFGDNHIPAGGNFFLARGQQSTFNVIHKWTSGRVWGKTGCDSNGANCLTGDAPPGGRTTFSAVTLAEFGLDSDFMNLDFYDISQVDGFNLPMAITPFGTNQGSKCRRVDCNFNFGVCPENFKVIGNSGSTVACKSACTATRDPNFCCPEPPFNRQTCPQPSDLTRIFKNQCPDAYSYAYDDETSLFSCISASPDSSGYEVKFCS